MTKKLTKRRKDIIPSVPMECVSNPYGADAMETFINWYELPSVSVYAQAMAKMLHEGVIVYKRGDREYYQVCRASVWPDRLMDIKAKGYGLDYACGHLPPYEEPQ